MFEVNKIYNKSYDSFFMCRTLIYSKGLLLRPLDNKTRPLLRPPIIYNKYVMDVFISNVALTMCVSNFQFDME